MSTTLDEGDDEPIYPTHQCFDDVANFYNELVAGGACASEIRRHITVHGIMFTPDGEPYAHGWIEVEPSRLVIQGGIRLGRRIFYGMRRADFLRSLPVWDETRYTIDECMELQRRCGMPPWREEYRVLCGDTRDTPLKSRQWKAPPAPILIRKDDRR
jgi:hypothetical protein